jgi:hypothetical protein
MKPLNTLPIEDFLNSARIAVKSNQKQVVLDIKQVQSLADSLSIVMTRLAGELDQVISSGSQKSDAIQIKMDGGGF